MRWLPPVLPPNVTFVLSCTPGPILDKLQQIGQWRLIWLAPIAEDARRQLAQKYLQQFGQDREVNARLSKVVAAEQCCNPLFLKLILDELRAVAMYETLNAHVDNLLQAQVVSPK